MAKKTKAQTKKRSRSDSITSQAEAVGAELRATPLNPPKHVKLRPGDRPFWTDITSARPRGTWNASDLTKAANLARTRADIERVTKTLAREGDTKVNARGTEIVNPLHNLLETLTRRDIILSKALHIHATATQGRADRGVGEKTKAAKGVKAAAGVVQGDEDGFLGTPESNRVH